MRLIFTDYRPPWRRAWRAIQTAAEYALGLAFTVGAVWAAAMILLSLERLP